MKNWQTLKAILYLALALLIFIFNGAVMSYVGFLVGGTVFLYAAEELIVLTARRELFNSPFHLFDGIAQLLIGVILFLVSDDVFKVCLVWGVWSILRESKEMAEAIVKLPKRKLCVINVIESVVVIVLSFLMIVNPSEARAHLHVLLLGAELVIVVVFYCLESWFYKNRENTDGEKSSFGEEISI